MRRVRVTVSGRVQGVFYRATCARLARERELAGAVRNLPDGRVEAVFEGPDEPVREMIDWCRRGTDLARVDGMEVSDEEPIGQTGFVVSG